MGKGAWPGVKSDLLFRERLVPVASPSYIASVSGNGAIDWAKVTYLRMSTVEYDWNAWIEGSGAQIEIADDLQFDTTMLASEAAASGAGIAVGRIPLVSADLQAGRLVKADARIVDIDTGYWLVGPTGQETRPAIRSFRTWVLDEAKRYRVENDLR
jgi:DNA-binding transcriptional LysR family regulator